jgi:hypothetical protein
MKAAAGAGAPEDFALYSRWPGPPPLQDNEVLRRAPVGRLAHHCHAADHEDKGMMGVVEVVA